MVECVCVYTMYCFEIEFLDLNSNNLIHHFVPQFKTLDEIMHVKRHYQ